MAKWGKETCTNMHGMLVFGIEINTCVVGVCMHMCVCAYTHTYACDASACLCPVSLRNGTVASQPRLPPGRGWE